MIDKSQEKTLFLEKLNALDLEPIAWQLLYSSRSQGWSFEKVLGTIAAYKRFLFFHYLYPNRALAPTDDVDLVWHCHILDTQKYVDDCQWLFGRIVHHYPYPTDHAA